MNEFFNDTMQGLLEAIEIEKGNIPLEEKCGMPAPTFIAAIRERELIDEIICIRKNQNISQKELASITGNKQQVISRLENKENSPSLKMFLKITYALGYEVKVVKSRKYKHI